MGCRKLSVQLEWASTAPTVARHLIAGWLEGMGHSERACRDAALVVSELVSAAINDRVGPPVLDAEIWHDALIVWVTNGKAIDIAPADNFGDLNAMVLSALCDDWGVEAAAASTRQWASLALT